MSEEIQKPSLGRIVLMNNGSGTDYPAIITRAHAYSPDLRVNLQAFEDRPGGVVWQAWIRYADPPLVGPYTWRWPPRVPS